MAWYECLYGGGGSGDIATGTFTPTTSDLHITLGFKPKQLAIYVAKTDNSAGVLFSYDENVSTTQHLYTASGEGLRFVNLGTTTVYRIKSIDNDGFTITGFSTAAWRGLGHYYAIG